MARCHSRVWKVAPLGFVLVVSAAHAAADAAPTTTTPAAPATTPAAVPESARRHGRREVPDYDGRPPAPPTAGEAFIWIPRALLLPVHLTAEYLLRRPVVAAIRYGDEHYVFKRIYDFLTWDGGQSGVYPIANIDLGLKNTIGLALVNHDFIAPANSIRAAWSVSTQGVFSVTAQDRLEVFRDGTGALYLGGQYIDRPDGVFYGVGPDSRTADKTFYSFLSRGAALGLVGHLGGLHHAAVEIGYRDTRFGASDISADTPSLDARYGGAGQAPLPAGWTGYDLAWTRAVLLLDSRNPSFESTGSGVRMEASGSYAQSPRTPALQLVSWGAEAGGFLDVTGARHVLSLQLAAHFVEQIGAAPIPFTELPALGGMVWMRGFLGGRLRGASTLAGTVQYRYPVTGFLEGELFSGVGNAFPGHLDGIALSRLFLSSGVGLRTTFARDASIAFTVAIASNRFDAPDFTLAEETRVSLGVIHGF
jgi:hypothetical protein